MEEITSDNYQWPSEQPIPRRAVRAHNMDVVIVLSAQMTSLSSKLEHHNINVTQTQACELCGKNHDSIHFQVRSPFAPSSTEQSHYVSNFQRQQNNPHSN